MKGKAARYISMSMADYCADPEAPANTNLAAMDKLGGLDGINLAGGGRITALLTSLWLARLGVPGRDLPPDSVWQVREAEVMTIDDYDFIINNGWQAFLGSYMPRVIDMAEFGEAMGWATKETLLSDAPVTVIWVIQQEQYLH